MAKDKKDITKVLFLVPYPSEGASNRIRVEQYIPYLESKGVACKVRPFMNRPFYKILYLPHRYLEKIFWFFICTVNRLFDLFRSASYDVIVVHREAYPFGEAFMEYMLHKLGKPIIFDFDDAIFLPNTSENNIYIDRFKKPGKIPKIIKMSSVVIAGNSDLAGYALRHNTRVVVIPSVIDTDIYVPVVHESGKKKIVIGWVGSNTTKRFLYDIKSALKELSSKYPDLQMEIVGADTYGLGLANVVNTPWSVKSEIEALKRFDIGIMPMPDNEWTRGKCGFKAILYMASGLPVVCSAVGANKEIVENGVTGFWATGIGEWTDKLSSLIEDRDLRERLGAAGRARAERYYSLNVCAPRFLKAINGRSDA
jgi:glycosyltransferase involved in cell wall biosynthesis